MSEIEAFEKFPSLVSDCDQCQSLCCIEPVDTSQKIDSVLFRGKPCEFLTTNESGKHGENCSIYNKPGKYKSNRCSVYQCYNLGPVISEFYEKEFKFNRLKPSNDNFWKERALAVDTIFFHFEQAYFKLMRSESGLVDTKNFLIEILNDLKNNNGRLTPEIETKIHNSKI